MTDVFTVKDLSPVKKCLKGHKYPKQYKKTCEFCVIKFGEKDGS